MNVIISDGKILFLSTLMGLSAVDTTSEKNQGEYLVNEMVMAM